jgi:nitroreductase
METWDAVTARRNVREFTDAAIPDADLDRILEAARRAPSAKNMQVWDFVVVTDREQLVELSKVWQGGGHIAGAAAAVATVIPDEPEPRLRELYRYDVGQATAQMMIVAADLGIGSGHSSVGDQELAREVLGLPSDRSVAVIIDFGYPTDRPLKPIVKPNRRDFDDVIHRGKW